MRKLISKSITIRDVAEAAGVSISLVSFVLNAKRGPDGEYLCSASQQTARRIVQVAKELGYHKNRAASSLRSGSSKTIGVIVADISNSFFGEICHHLETISAEEGYLMVFGSSNDDPGMMCQLVNKFIASGVDGLIISPCAHTEAFITDTVRNFVPVVLVDRNLENVEGVGRVMLDNHEAGRNATSHFLSNGFRKIAMVRYRTDMPTIIERFRGFEDCMREEGLEDMLGNIIIEKDNIDVEMEMSIRSAVNAGTEAFIFPSNLLTIKGISAINRLGYRIPEDIAVVGFDQERNASIYNPPLTHVYQSTALVARHSFDMLKEFIDGQCQEKFVSISPNFVLGQSSSRASAHHSICCTASARTDSVSVEDARAAISQIVGGGK